MASKSSDSLIRDLTQGSVTRLLLIFAFPLLCSNLLQTVYNMVDMIVIGRFVGHSFIFHRASSNCLLISLLRITSISSVSRYALLMSILKEPIGCGDSRSIIPPGVNGKTSGVRILPACLLNARNLALVGELSEANTANAVVAQIRMGSAADLAAVIVASRELGSFCCFITIDFLAIILSSD